MHTQPCTLENPYTEKFQLVWNLYNSDVPPEGKRILLSVMNWFTGGSEAQLMRLKGIKE